MYDDLCVQYGIARKGRHTPKAHTPSLIIPAPLQFPFNNTGEFEGQSVTFVELLVNQPILVQSVFIAQAFIFEEVTYFTIILTALSCGNNNRIITICCLLCFCSIIFPFFADAATHSSHFISDMSDSKKRKKRP